MSGSDTPGPPEPTPQGHSSLEAQPGDSGFSSFLRDVAQAPAVAPRLPKLGAGSVIADTYRVVSELGAGGMGVVFRATDLRLKRSVALKVHTRTRGEPGLELLRVEARALAHLTHPNVVKVFEVGSHNERLFIAMEFVDGGTLDRWHVDRSWREVIEVYLQAGEGLAAAHRSGLVHRDFKPANVLIGRDGRPRVADFGLVLDLSLTEGRTLEESTGDAARTPIGADSAPLVGLSAHAMVGTPRYMAPEQAEGRGADHRADQYAWCSALFEALTGDVPVDHLTELPTRAGVPPDVWRAIITGLAEDPKGRHESMDDLLGSLRLAIRPRRRGAWVAAAALGGLSLIGAAVLYTNGPTSPQLQCEQDARLTVQAWATDRTPMLAALRKDGDVARADAFAEQLDDYASRWLVMREAVCAAQEDPRRRDAATQCLGHRARALTGTVEVVAATPPDPAAPLRTLPLPGLERCSLERALQASRPAAEPSEAAEVELVFSDVAKASALIWNGKADAARTLAHATLRRANRLTHAPARIAALNRAGDAELEVGRPKHSLPYYEQAFYLAQSQGYDEEAAQAGGGLIEALQYIGDQRGADRWVQHAMAAFERLPDDVDPEGEISLLSSIGNLRSEQGRFTEALRIQRKILSALPTTGDEVRRSKAHNSLGSTLYNMGDSTGAVEQFEISLALNDAARGPDHPDNVYPLANLAWILIETEKLDRAALLLDRAIELLRNKTADDAYAFATLLSHRGSLHDERGDHHKAVEVYAEGLALAKAELGGDHEITGLLLNNQASSYEALGDVDRARETYEEAVRALEQAGLPGADELALARENLAQLAARRHPLAQTTAAATDG